MISRPSQAFMAAERKRRSAARRGFKSGASERQLRDLRDLAFRLKVEMPRVVFAEDADKATRKLTKNLAHRRQPMLEGMG